MCQFLCLGLFDVLAAGLLRLPPWCRLSGGIQEGAALTHGEEAGVVCLTDSVVLRGPTGHLTGYCSQDRGWTGQLLPVGGDDEAVQTPCCLLLFSVCEPSHR